jgi:hypothetical protein
MSNTSSEEIREELKIRIGDFRAINNRHYFENIDVSKFKKGMDVKDALLIIKLAMEGYERELQGELDGKSVAQIDHDYDRYLAEFDAFIKVLKNCFYK